MEEENLGRDRAEVGRKGEDLALEYLQKRGMSIVARNWRCGHKELDLIADDGLFLRIVEVRTLCYPNVRPPAESIGPMKRRKIMAAARRFVAEHGIINEVAFDIVSVVVNGEFYSLEYIENAFLPEW